EAFDKIARLLDLGYPGGPAIDRLAKRGDPASIQFPRALRGQGLDFSYSGLKTAVVRYVRGLEAAGERMKRADIAASFQEAVVDVQVEKTLRAAATMEVDTVVVGGGVAANSRLRERLGAEAAERGLRLVVPSGRL